MLWWRLRAMDKKFDYADFSQLNPWLSVEVDYSLNPWPRPPNKFVAFKPEPAMMFRVWEKTK